MDNMFVLDNPATFSIWASVDEEKKLDAARHLSNLYNFPIAQCYQLISEALANGEKVEIFRHCGWYDANQYMAAAETECNT